MSGVLINLYSKQFISDYAQTALYDAGEYLEEKADVERVEVAKEKNWINTDIRPITLNYTDKSWNWDWSTTQHLHQQLPESPFRKKNETVEERKQRELEAEARKNRWIGSLLWGIASWLAARTYKAYTRQKATLDYTVVMRTAVEALPNNIPIKYSLQNLTCCLHKIDTLNHQKIKVYFLAASLLFIGAASLTAGAFAVISFYMTAGKITMVISAVIATGNLGLHWTDDQALRHYYQLIGGDKMKHQGWANHILSVDLPNYDDNMSLRSQQQYVFVPDPNYQPLYPLFCANIPMNQPPPTFQSV